MYHKLRKKEKKKNEPDRHTTVLLLELVQRERERELISLPHPLPPISHSKAHATHRVHLPGGAQRIARAPGGPFPTRVRWRVTECVCRVSHNSCPRHERWSLVRLHDRLAAGRVSGPRTERRERDREGENRKKNERAQVSNLKPNVSVAMINE